MILRECEPVRGVAYVSKAVVGALSGRRIWGDLIVAVRLRPEHVVHPLVLFLREAYRVS